MITTLSWRRGDAPPADATGRLRAQPLLAVDGGGTEVVHLRADTATEAQTRREGQLAVVVAGSGTVEVGDERVEVATGDAVRLPAGHRHRLATRSGLSAVVVTYPETRSSWRVIRRLANGARWVAGVFSDTEQARGCRDRLQEELDDGEVTLE